MNQNASLRVRVYEDLKRRILMNEVKQGEYLEEKALCEAYGVSRTPVREAMSLLEKEELIRIYPNKGAFVTELSIQAVKELFQVRHLLEPLAWKLAFPQLDLSELKRYRDETSKALERKDYPQLHELDYEFHNYVHHLCNNKYLIQYLSLTADKFQMVRTQPFYTVKRTEGGAHEHIQLINLIIEGKEEEALALLTQHIANTERYYFSSLIGS